LYSPYKLERREICPVNVACPCVHADTFSLTYKKKNLGLTSFILKKKRRHLQRQKLYYFFAIKLVKQKGW
jgi:hypothetical protein